MKKILFILRSLPHNGSQLQEKMDVILTAAAFDQQVALLFLDDGVFQLKKGQQPEKHGLKDTLSIFNALEIYDVNAIYTEIESLQERGLKSCALNLPVKELNRENINELIQQFTIVI